MTDCNADGPSANSPNADTSKPRMAGQDRSMTDPTHLQHRIEEAARRRAELERVRNAGDDRSRATGYEMQLQKARADREKALAQRAMEQAPDDPADPQDLRARLRAQNITLEEALGEIGAASASQSFAKPWPVAGAWRQPGMQDPAHAPQASTGRVAMLGKFSTGLTAGLAACVVVLVVGSSVYRDIAGQFDGGARVPDVTLNLADIASPDAQVASVSLASGLYESSAEVVARAAINPLAPPSPLADVGNLVSLPRGALAPIAATDTPPAALPVPPAQETAGYGTRSDGMAWGLPAVGVRAELAPSLVDSPPTIEATVATPVHRDVEIALAPPSVVPDADVPAGIAGGVQPAEAARVIQMAALRPQAVADLMPDVARLRDRAGASSVQARAPAMTVSPELVAASDIGSSDITMPHRATVLPQGLPGVGSNRDRAVDPDRARPVRPITQPVQATVALSLPGEIGSAVTVPERDRSLDRSTRVAALPDLGTEAPFDRQAVEPAPAPRMNVRAVFTVSSESAIDAEWLNRIGVDIAEVQVTPFSISRTRVHYFHVEDASDADDVASRLGGDVIDMTSVVPSPPPGLLEVQLSD